MAIMYPYHTLAASKNNNMKKLKTFTAILGSNLPLSEASKHYLAAFFGDSDWYSINEMLDAGKCSEYPNQRNTISRAFSQLKEAGVEKILNDLL